MDPDDGEVEKDLQRFQSQDGVPLQSLRGRYDNELEEYYLQWNKVEEAFPDLNHLLVPSYACIFLIDQNCQL